MWKSLYQGNLKMCVTTSSVALCNLAVPPEIPSIKRLQKCEGLYGRPQGYESSWSNALWESDWYREVRASFQIPTKLFDGHPFFHRKGDPQKNISARTYLLTNQVLKLPSPVTFRLPRNKILRCHHRVTRDPFLLNFAVAGIRQCMFERDRERERDRKGREGGGERIHVCLFTGLRRNLWLCYILANHGQSQSRNPGVP